ncbi:hypothetical protein JX140_003989 [Escherichia coli]|nr:hypothetical protein [Escherichia coli]
MSIFNKHAHQERPYIVIVDIDGTISEATEDRLHLLPPPGKGALTKDWNEFNLACDTDNHELIHSQDLIMLRSGEFSKSPIRVSFCPFCGESLKTWEAEATSE